jgi:hypothetical protein
MQPALSVQIVGAVQFDAALRLKLDLAAWIVRRFRPVDTVGTIGHTKHQPRIFAAGEHHLETTRRIRLLWFIINDATRGHELPLVQVHEIVVAIAPVFHCAQIGLFPHLAVLAFGETDAVVPPFILVAHAEIPHPQFALHLEHRAVVNHASAIG